MEITESRRLEMEQQFQRKFGMDVSDTIMGHLPPNGWHNVATTADIVGLHTEIELFRAVTKSEFNLIRSDIKKDLELLEYKIVTALHQELAKQNKWMTGILATLCVSLMVLVLR